MNCVCRGVCKKGSAARAPADNSCFIPRLTAYREFEELIFKNCQSEGYPSDEIGFYLLPIERARAFYCSVDLHFSPDDASHVHLLYEQLCEKLVENGAFFDRPYGKLAELVYSRTEMYSKYLKQIKNKIDPNNIMNPGKLCFH